MTIATAIDTRTYAQTTGVSTCPEEDLRNMATEVDRLAVDVVASARRAVRSALQAGELLIRMKALVPDGMWKAWLKDNVRTTYTTCTVYMDIARNRELVSEEIAAGETLTVIQAAIRAKLGPRRITTGPRRTPTAPARKSIGIEDYMIEGMAVWLCKKFAQYGLFTPYVTDKVRRVAVSALNSALRPD